MVHYNMSFQIAAIVLVLLVTVHFILQKKLHDTGTKIFLAVLLLGGLYIVLDFLGTLLIFAYSRENAQLIELLLTCFYTFDVLFPCILYGYIRNMLKSQEGRFSSVRRILLAVIPVFMLILVWGNIQTGWFFEFDGQNDFVIGPWYFGLYIYDIVYVVLVISHLANNLRGYNQWKRYVFWEFLLVEGICMGIQFYTESQLLSGFGMALGIILLYLTLSNSGDCVDGMTGIFDKQYFDHWIQEKIRRNTEFHILAMEAYRLKQVNKIYGTSVGDQLLIQIADGIRTVTGSSQIFRVTGNCLLVVEDSLTAYERDRERIQAYFQKPLEVGEEKVDFPVVICGIINGQKMGQEDMLVGYIEYLAGLVRNTDETVVIQSDNRILEGFRYEKEVEHFLKTAVEQDLFEVYYQPVYSLKEKRFITLEALSRLRHPDMGMIPPDVFINIAERQGEISQIALLQFRRVCGFVKENEQIMEKIKNVKFNLSPSELMKPGYSQKLIDVIREYGLKSEYFQFEITESVATEYSESFCSAVEDFNKAGIQLCLDDFGSGYANLNAVLKVPFAVVKIDRSLLNGICSDVQAADFYRSIVMTMKSMGYMIVAEGAETEEEVELLGKWGVDMIQGFYFSRPLPEKDILKII